MRTIAVTCLLVCLATSMAFHPLSHSTTSRPNRILQDVRSRQLTFESAANQGRVCQAQNTLVVMSAFGGKGEEKTSNDAPPSPRRASRLQRWKRRVVTASRTLLLASAFFAAKSKPAEAKFSYEIREERKYSIRPGATQEQASQLVEGEVPEDIEEAKSVFDKVNSEPSATPSAPESKKASAPKSNSFDYGDEDEDGDDDFSDFDGPTNVRAAPLTGGKASASRSQRAASEQLQSSSRSQFSGIDTSKTKTRGMYVKVSVGLFIPTWGAMGVREFVRRRKEEVYVQKGLQILEAQKAEYFNVTETTPDSDIEDELKDLKDDEDEDDEDDDDDDDDEEDGPDFRSRSKGPKKPSGGDGSGGSSGDGEGPGYGKPSDDDLKRLGDLFNKS